MPQFGEYIKPDIRHHNPGMPKPVSPNLPPRRGEAKLPDNLNWLRPFVEEMKDQLINRVFKRVMKVFMPYYYFPPFYHVPVDMLERVQVNAGGTMTILRLVVPQDQMARIKFYGQDITAIPPAILPGTQWREVAWTFRVNGAPLAYYGNFLGQRGILNLAPAETTIVLDGTDVFEILATNNSAANNYFVWASLSGWQWSKLSTPLPDADMLED